MVSTGELCEALEQGQGSVRWIERRRGWKQGEQWASWGHRPGEEQDRFVLKARGRGQEGFPFMFTASPEDCRSRWRTPLCPDPHLVRLYLRYAALPPAPPPPPSHLHAGLWDVTYSGLGALSFIIHLCCISSQESLKRI